MKDILHHPKMLFIFINKNFRLRSLSTNCASCSACELKCIELSIPMSKSKGLGSKLQSFTGIQNFGLQKNLKQSGCCCLALYCKGNLRPRPHVSGSLENASFLSVLGSRPHGDGVFGHRKRIFSKTLSRVDLFEKAVFLLSCGRVKTELFDNADVTASI